MVAVGPPHPLSYITESSANHDRASSQDQNRAYTMFQATPQMFAPHSSPSPPRHTVTEKRIMTTGPNGEQKPRKMRASCDACSRAKVTLPYLLFKFTLLMSSQVKCDKVRPTCHRCGNMSICCNYSPSMRYAHTFYMPSDATSGS
jgi:hypothetical protein